MRGYVDTDAITMDEGILYLIFVSLSTSFISAIF